MERSRFTLSSNQVEKLRYSLKLFIDRMDKGAPNYWELHSIIHSLQRNTFRLADEKKYTFEVYEVRVLNLALRVYVNELATDIANALEIHAPQVEDLMDMQQDVFSLLHKFKLYYKDIPGA